MTGNAIERFSIECRNKLANCFGFALLHSIPRGLVGYTNMAAVTSRGNTLIYGHEFSKIARAVDHRCFHSNFRIALYNLFCTLYPIYAFVIAQSETRKSFEYIIWPEKGFCETVVEGYGTFAAIVFFRVTDGFLCV